MVVVGVASTVSSDSSKWYVMLTHPARASHCSEHFIHSAIYLIFITPYVVGTTVIHIFRCQMWKPRPKRLNNVTCCHTADAWQSWDLNLGLLAQVNTLKQ